MRVSRLSLSIAILGVCASLTSCGKYSDKPKGVTATSGVTKIACEQAFENIMEQEIEVFEYIYPDANILPYYTNELACVDSLMSAKVSSVVITRELTAEETKTLTEQKRKPKSSLIAVDAIALIVNKDNPVEILSTEEVREILTGEVKNWNEISPSKLGNIEVVFDHAGSSSVNYMRNKLTNGVPFGDNVFAQGSNQDVINAVKNHPGAIGIIGVGWLTADLDGRTVNRAQELAEASEKNDTTQLSSSVDQFNPEIKVLKIREEGKIEAYKPYQLDIYNGDYPFFRQIYMITTGVGGTPSHGFYSFVTSVRGQKLILLTGILPGKVYQRQVAID